MIRHSLTCICCLEGQGFLGSSSDRMGCSLLVLVLLGKYHQPCRTLGKSRKKIVSSNRVKLLSYFNATSIFISLITLFLVINDRGPLRKDEKQRQQGTYSRRALDWVGMTYRCWCKTWTEKQVKMVVRHCGCQTSSHLRLIKVIHHFTEVMYKTSEVKPVIIRVCSSYLLRCLVGVQRVSEGSVWVRLIYERGEKLQSLHHCQLNLIKRPPFLVLGNNRGMGLTSLTTEHFCEKKLIRYYDMTYYQRESCPPVKRGNNSHNRFITQEQFKCLN